MKRLTLRLIIALLTFATGIAISLYWTAHHAQLSSVNRRAMNDDDDDARKDKLVANGGSVAYSGVSFSYHPALASEVKAETVPASSSLDDSQSKLEGVPTEHVAFTFVPRQHESGFWGLPEIDVWRLADYQQAIGHSEIYAEGLREAVETLKVILAERPSAPALEKMLAGRKFPEQHDIPFLPFIDAKQAFHARVKYVSFKNGKGIMFLTQYNIETSLINNEGLAYVFQGLTDDGVYAVSATFPVSASFLPQDFTTERAGNFERPENFYLLLNESKEYQSYLKTVVPRLEALPPDKYEPALTHFEELVRSLSVRARNPAGN